MKTIDPHRAIFFLERARTYTKSKGEDTEILEMISLFVQKFEFATAVQDDDSEDDCVDDDSPTDNTIIEFHEPEPKSLTAWGVDVCWNPQATCLAEGFVWDQYFTVDQIHAFLVPYQYHKIFDAKTVY